MLIIILRFLCGEYYLGDEDALRVWAEQVSVRVVREAACSVVSVVGLGRSGDSQLHVERFQLKWGDKRPQPKMNKMEVCMISLWV